MKWIALYNTVNRKLLKLHLIFHALKNKRLKMALFGEVTVGS